MNNRSKTGRTMKQVSHTHPFTGETFGSVYRRGPLLADGGQTVPVRTGEQTEPHEEQPRMRDIDHTPRHDAETNRVWYRGRPAEVDDGDNQ